MLKGTKHKDSTKEKMSKIKIGHRHSEETKRKISNSEKGKILSEETIAKYRNRIVSLETRLKMSNARRGEKNNLWKGGITPINKIIRGSLEYKLWRKAVFERDGYSCIWCGQKGGELNADHIKRFSDYPELRFAIDNGRTLCLSCHKTTDNYGRKGT